eukprot:SAG11_NODE_39613_length_227_cov_13.351562_1_plen_70_part_10
MSDYCEKYNNFAKLDFSHEKERIEECKILSTENYRLLKENYTLLLNIREFKQEFYNLLCTNNDEVDNEDV